MKQVVSELMELARRSEWRVQRELDGMARQKQMSRVNEVRRKIGARYRECRLSNFVPYGSPAEKKRQAAIVERLEAIDLDDSIRVGQSLVFFGPVGTGKDHLMSAMLLRAAFRTRFSIEFVDGMSMYGAFRDGIDSADSEAKVINRFTRPDLLSISDPIPPIGEKSGWIIEQLFRVIDTRYREKRATWLTMNISGRNDGDAALSAPVFDRLMDGAELFHCNWPSFRQPRQ